MKKIKSLALAATLVCAGLGSLSAATFVVVNDADDGVEFPAAKNTIVAADFEPVRPNFGENKIFIKSVAALSSSATPLVRLNTMAWMGGALVPTDRTTDPTAVYGIPSNGWQWFDPCTTVSNKAWLGKPNPTNQFANENNFRMTFPLACVGNPTGYWCRITGSLTNVQPAFFAISMASDGITPLAFSPTFVGFDKGPNGIAESNWSPTQAKWVKGGDDDVYDGPRNGTNVFPSNVKVDYAQRFGASVTISANSISDFGDVIRQFGTGPQTLTVELVTNGVTAASQIVTNAVPSVVIQDTGTAVRLKLVGGQLNVPHEIQKRANLTGAPWVIVPDALFVSAPGIDLPKSEPHEFYRVRQIP